MRSVDADILRTPVYRARTPSGGGGGRNVMSERERKIGRECVRERERLLIKYSKNSVSAL